MLRRAQRTMQTGNSFPSDKEESMESASPSTHIGQSYQMAHKAGKRIKKKGLHKE